MKKVYSVLASLLAVGLVSATSHSVGGGATNADVVGGGIASFFGGILDSVQANPANLSTILFGALIWMVLYSVVKKMEMFEGFTFMPSIVSIILTILSFIYIPAEIFNVAGANVGALGATIITVFPILIAFYFTVKVANNQSTARVIWGGYLLYYIVILVYTYLYAPAATSFFSLKPGTETFKSSFYLIGAAISIAMIIFLPAIREKMWDFELEDKKEKAKRRVDNFGATLDLGTQVIDAASGK